MCMSLFNQCSRMINRIYKGLIALCFLIFLSSTGLYGQETAHITLDSINSSYDEHSPVLAPDGQRLYFTRSGHPANIGGVLDQGDIWYAEKSGDGWSGPIHAGREINHPGLNGVVGFSADGKRLYLLNYFDESARAGSKLKNGIAVSNLVNGNWGKPDSLPIKFFSNSSSHISATISRDETILIISMISYNTEGNEDLYVSLKQPNGEWSQPEGLGTVVNTFAEEWTPFLASDNRTLYFTSNGLNGFGSRDIFKTKRQGDSWSDWSVPKNLGSSINTKGVEQGYSLPLRGNTAYFSSTQNSEGFGDLFGFPIDKEDSVIIEAPIIVEPEPELPEVVEPEIPDVIMAFQVLDQRTNSPVDTEVRLVYGNQEKVINTADLQGSGKQFESGFKNGTQVKVMIEAEGYLKFERSFTANSAWKTSNNGLQKLLLIAEEVGTKVEIENVLFSRASDSFADAETAEQQIDELIELMKLNPGMAIRLEGHTDNSGNAKLLKDLSEARVRTVRNYMLTKGIAGSRIEVVGYGGTRPVSKSNTASGREINRRVEFVIIR